MYNINIDNEFLDIDTGEFYFIAKDSLFNNCIHNKYTQLINNSNLLKFKNESNIVSNTAIKYIIFKKYNTDINFEDMVLSSICKDEDYLNSIIDDLFYFLLAMRLSDSGHVQIHKLYVLSDNYYEERFTHISIQNEELDFFNRYKNDFNLSENNRQNIVYIYNKLKENTNSNYLPFVHWMNYYSSSSLYDKIFKLSTALECSILCDVKDSLTYRLCIRSCKLLKENVYSTAKIFYDLRSSIVHNGNITEEVSKKLRKFLDSEENEMDLLNDFIINHMESLVRKILVKYIELLGTPDIKNFSDITKMIDQQIIEAISK